MILIDSIEELTAYGKLDEGVSIKFVIIIDKFYAIALLALMQSDGFLKLPRRMLDITDELLAIFPPPRHSLEYVDTELLTAKPVIMLETPEVDGEYYRQDGRHRIQGYAELGYKQIPAVWVPKSYWGQFIIGHRVDPSINLSIDQLKARPDMAIPYSWDRSPAAPKHGPGEHDEPCFVLPSLFPSEPKLQLRNAASYAAFRDA